jgi:putative ATPase
VRAPEETSRSLEAAAPGGECGSTLADLLWGETVGQGQRCSIRLTGRASGGERALSSLRWGMAQQRLPVSAPPAPLAARMRPRDLDEFVGQEHIIGPGRLLRRAIEADQLSSLLFYGPPGTGKTTLARVIAARTRASFTALNAVLAGVKDLRQAVTEAKTRRDDLGGRTLLFVDEVHRFNKAQQDALLPWVEDGTVVLIGATTENPYFEVNKALVSRSRVFQLRPLTEGHLAVILQAALDDPERGYGKLRVQLLAAASDHLVDVANGDARAALNALELAVETTPPGEDGVIVIDLAVAEESIQRRAVLYDREGDAHFDTISAFIKSVRGSDPDAALYWLARMIYAGEDPRFILRRLIILASEDIGLADPQAVSVVMSCAQAFDRIGMPEGRFPLAQATLYLAGTDKSNSTMALFDALDAVARERSGDVPTHLKDGSRDKAAFGHGQGYLYPHAYRDHWVAQQYLPDSLRGRLFYQPGDQGWEGKMGDLLVRRREAQLAAMVEGAGLAPVEQLTAGPTDRRLERWVQRTAGRVGQRLAAVRDALFEEAALQRHHLVLDVEPGTGLLTFEALRQTPEGGTWAWSTRADQAQALRALAERLPVLKRPTIIDGPLETGAVRFDRIIGRDVLVRAAEPAALLGQLSALRLPGGRMLFAEQLARHTPRLSALLPALPEPLRTQWAAAEEAIYSDESDPLTRWTAARLVALMETAVAGVSVDQRLVETEHALHVTAAVVERWFSDRPGGYQARLAAQLDESVIAAITAAVRAGLVGETIPWRATVVLLSGS